MSVVTVRRAEERGQTRIDWLDSKHSFSFGEYYDPHWMGFGPLRVINDDIVQAARGFGMHGHRDMEIVTVTVTGALQHQDSLGNGEVLYPGEVQAMSAGSGIRHSEWNPSETEAARFIQIWIEPRSVGGAPAYAQRAIPQDAMKNACALIATGRGHHASALSINQDADIFRAVLEEGATVQHTLATHRKAWLQLITGDVEVEGIVMKSGDGAAVQGLDLITIRGLTPETDLLLFDLP